MEGNPPTNLPVSPGEAAILAHLSHYKEQLDRIEKQAAATNGRVTQLEIWQASMRGAWKVAVILGPIASGMIVGVVVKLI